MIDALKQELWSRGFVVPIWIVDDAPNSRHAALMARIAEKSGLHVVRHAVSLGRGAALRTGINAILTHGERVASIVTVDGDGRYGSDDVVRLVARVEEDASRLYLGVRRFERDAPLAQRFGNAVNGAVTRILTGLRVSDTQTGLRALPRDLCEAALHIPLNGYEFESECLIEARRLREGPLPIVEVPIDSVRSATGLRREFNPLLDSMWVYFVFLRYCAGSLLTFLTDYFVFVLVYLQTHSIGLGIAFARGVAIFVSFVLNRSAVFRFRHAAAPAFARFLLLVATLGWISYLATSWLAHAFAMPPPAAKLLVEAVLFFAGFALNNVFVFGHTASDDGRTDWDDYYARPYRAAGVTRRITTERLIRVMREYDPARSSRRPMLLELGGANSCFISALRRSLAPAEYHIADNNRTGLALSRERLRPGEPVFVHDVDLLRDTVPLQADITFSVGLIEHFDEAGTARLIEEHFRATRAGGLVVITFPTATWLYRAIRFVSERLRMWIFFDERPLSEHEVLAAAGARGRVLYSRINWAIGLTQRVMAFRCESSGDDADPAATTARQSTRARSKPVERVPSDADS